jgi:hypothetical protein
MQNQAKEQQWTGAEACQLRSKRDPPKQLQASVVDVQELL